MNAVDCVYVVRWNGVFEKNQPKTMNKRSRTRNDLDAFNPTLHLSYGYCNKIKNWHSGI
jgi:hypothetical protein